MKFFHWDKQCKQEIERFKELIKSQKALIETLKNNDDQYADQRKELWNEISELKIKNQVSLQGISINEKVADDLRIQIAKLEIENKYLKSQIPKDPEQGAIIYQAPELTLELERPKKKK